MIKGIQTVVTDYAHIEITITITITIKIKTMMGSFYWNWRIIHGHKTAYTCTYIHSQWQAKKIHQIFLYKLESPTDFAFFDNS